MDFKEQIKNYFPVFFISVLKTAKFWKHLTTLHICARMRSLRNKQALYLFCLLNILGSFMVDTRFVFHELGSCCSKSSVDVIRSGSKSDHHWSLNDFALTLANS